MRTGSSLFLLGILLLIQLPYLPPLALVALLPLAVILLFKRSYWRWPAWFLCGFLWTLLRADCMLSDRLDKQIEGQILLVEGKVVSLPEKFTTVMRFDLQVDRLADPGGKDYQHPDTIRLNWYRPYPELQPGEHWRLQVKLKRPYGFMNPGGFDYEGYLFQAGLGATGYIVNREDNVRLAGASNFYIHQIRFRIRSMLERLLGDDPMLSLVAGLAIGDRSGITPQQWRILTNTGINHLLAISGFHIGMVAAFGFFITRWLWPLCVGMSRTLAGPRVATVVAAVSALLYSALAGFSIPTQRTVIMLGVVLLLTGLNRMTRSTNILALSLIVILIVDPFAAMSVSFWLSFLAIAVILYSMSSRVGVTGFWWRWGHVQWVVAVGLTPVLILWFQQVSLVGIVANLIAVPWVSLLTVPLVLAGIATVCVHAGAGAFLLHLSASSLKLLWVFLELISQPEASVLQTAAPTVPALIAAVIGAILLLMPTGLPGRWLGLIWLIPLFMPPQPDLASGQFRFILLDVGQGLAAAVHTRHHTLLFDTGPRFSDRFDAGEAVVLPYLQYQGIRQIDRLIASHGDSDHIGGLPQVLAGVAVSDVSTSAPEKISYFPVTACRAGDNWVWDGVSFSMLYPQPSESLRGNNLSCVLRISAGGHSLLLTGDIQRPAEQRLVARYGGQLQTDVLVAPHHGSNTSSSPAFVRAVAPTYVLFPAGYRNRFGFPKQDIISRYETNGAIPLATAVSGAIEMTFLEHGIQVTQYRQRLRRFWHTED
ncbi:MAG: hypothetical protein HW386_1814 [Gammaproteobacteria bacterium]|nr:hypothetical protein [Gammaproteobacteria bacterium]